MNTQKAFWLSGAATLAVMLFLAGVLWLRPVPQNTASRATYQEQEYGERHHREHHRQHEEREHHR